MAQELTINEAYTLLGRVTLQALRDATNERLDPATRAEAQQWCEICAPDLLQRWDAKQRRKRKGSHRSRPKKERGYPMQAR